MLQKNAFIFFLILFSLLLINCRSHRAWEMRGFEKTATNPILVADSTYTFFCPIQKKLVHWQKADVFNPAAVVKGGKVYLLFRAEDNPDAILGGRTSRVGLATSEDGIHFKKYPTPVFFPADDDFKKWDYPGGVEDPRVVETEEGLYVMTYTSWNRDLARLSVATSNDLFNWKKYGPVFQKAHNGQFLNIWSKSGAIITVLKNGRLVAAKIQEKYWMYWGETFVNLAWSENLTDWTPLLDEKGALLQVMKARKGFYDSHLVEPGPPALMTPNGIILFYNGRNSEVDTLTDPNLPKGTYTGGQALFDKNNPATLLARSKNYYIKPDLPHEISGQYQSGTTFTEGLVYFNKKWLMYYGTADSMVGLSIKE